MSTQRPLDLSSLQFFRLISEPLPTPKLYYGRFLALHMKIFDAEVRKLRNAYNKLTVLATHIAKEKGYKDLIFVSDILIDKETLETSMCLFALYCPKTTSESALLSLRKIIEIKIEQAQVAIDKMLEIDPQNPDLVPLGIIGNEDSDEKRVFVEDRHTFEAVHTIYSAPTRRLEPSNGTSETPISISRPVNCPPPGSRETEITITLLGTLEEADNAKSSFRFTYYKDEKLVSEIVKCDSVVIYKQLRDYFPKDIVVELTLTTIEKTNHKGVLLQSPHKVLDYQAFPDSSVSQFTNTQESFDI